MRYVTITELSDMIRKNLWKIPHDIDLVVGIPRSGMLPATMIALFLNTRLTDIDSFVEGRIYCNGLTRGMYVNNSEIKNILIVDDSIDTGKSLLNAKKKLGAISNGDFNYVFCIPIATKLGAEMVDLYFEIIDEDRVFEWNIFHHGVLASACVDIDGVLCVDPIEDDDGEKYQKFLQTAAPLFTPTCKINTLISCRLEKYRTQSESWLKRHNIDYGQLIMLNLPYKAARVEWNRYGEYKGKYYKGREDCVLFIESSYIQARTIAEVSKKAVYCMETNTILQTPSTISKKKKVLHAIKKRFPDGYQRLRDIFYRIMK